MAEVCDPAIAGFGPSFVVSSMGSPTVAGLRWLSPDRGPSGDFIPELSGVAQHSKSPGGTEDVVVTGRGRATTSETNSYAKYEGETE